VGADGAPLDEAPIVLSLRQSGELGSNSIPQSGIGSSI